MKSLTPLARRSIVDEAHEAMRGHILHGAWRAGEKLPTEAELTGSLGVSRSTVREALNRLASSGLIEIRHGGSKRVRDFRDHAGLEVLSELVASPTGVVNLGVVRAVVELRAVLAPDVARKAARRRSLAQAAALVELADGLVGSSSLDALLKSTMGWWSQLVLASDNLAYRLAFNTLAGTHLEGSTQMRRLISAELRAVNRYQAIARAVLAQRPEEAATACAALVSLGSEALFAAIAAQENR
jgi:GntR family transcriptional regulator, transcriptional repressor for pyruvate dehydrogenase complex